MVVCRLLKSEPLIRRADSLTEATSGEAEQGVERKTRRRWRSGGSEIRDKEGDTLLKGNAEEDKEKARDTSGGNRGDRRASTKGRRGERGIRSDRDVRSDLVGESNLAK